MSGAREASRGRPRTGVARRWPAPRWLRELRSGRASLRAVRAVRRGRGERLSAGDVSYRIYLGVMLSITVVAPAVRVLVLGAAPVVPTLGAAHVPGMAAALTALTAGAVLLGGTTGPARAGLPQLDLLYPSAIPRGLLLARPVLGWLGVGALLGAVAGALVAIARALAGAGVGSTADAAGTAAGDAAGSGVVADALGAAAAAAAPFGAGEVGLLLAAGASLGVLVSGAQLLGQLGPRVRGFLAGALVLLAGLQLGGLSGVGGLAWAGGPGGADGTGGPDVVNAWEPWSAAAWLVVAGGAVPGGSSGTSGMLGTLGVLAIPALLLAGTALPLATRLDRGLLRAQAETWSGARALALSGDPSAALARLGRPVTWGRRLRLAVGRGTVAPFVRRDLLGIVRAPGRSLAALGGVAAAGALWLAAVQGPRGLTSAALLGAGALVVAVTALGPWTRGIATAAAGSGSPPLLPFSPRGLLARHSGVPAALALVVLTGGGLLLWGSGGAAALSAGPPMRFLLAVPALAAAAVLLRIAAALKGTIPLRLLAPVPTAAGDLSAVNVFLWSVDGPLAAALTGAVLGALWAASASLLGLALAVAGTLIVCGVLLLWIQSRLGAPAGDP